MSEILLWVYVVMVGVLMGGGLFERAVLVHVWSSDPPDSVRSWNPNPKYALDPPRRFFMYVTLPVMILTPWNAFYAWRSAGPMRFWLLLSAGLVMFVIIITVGYFAPVMISLTERKGEGMDSETIVRKVRTWVTLQYFRLGILLLGWLAALQAFRLLQ
jgi:Domain of unknown function (DUF1772)